MAGSLAHAGVSQVDAVWVNGEPLASDGAHVSARDRGLTLADGVFETMRVRNGQVFRLERHLARLSEALATLGIPAPPELKEWVHMAGRASGADAGLRLTVTRGIGAGGVAPPARPRPTVILALGPRPEFPSSTYEAGLTAHVASGRRNERAMTAGLKTLAYTDAVAALLEAQRAGADEALFLDTEGHCSEATASNLFVWTGNALLMPPVSCGALPGITRAAILEVARAAMVDVEERAFGPEELLSGQEAFLTSSLRGVAPLVRLNGAPVGTGRPGSMTRRLSESYAALVERECGG